MTFEYQVAVRYKFTKNINLSNKGKSWYYIILSYVLLYCTILYYGICVFEFIILFYCTLILCFITLFILYYIYMCSTIHLAGHLPEAILALRPETLLGPSGRLGLPSQHRPEKVLGHPRHRWHRWQILKLHEKL